jgi:hypothetical protein
MYNDDSYSDDNSDQECYLDGCRVKYNIWKHYRHLYPLCEEYERAFELIIDNSCVEQMTNTINLYHKTVSDIIFPSNFNERGIIQIIFDYIYCKVVQFPSNYSPRVGDYIRIWVDRLECSRVGQIVQIYYDQRTKDENRVIANDSMCDLYKYDCSIGWNGFYYMN